MNSGPAIGVPFERSFALFDHQGRLVEWDAGFAGEFAAAALLIAPGARFADLLIAGYDQDGVARADRAPSIDSDLDKAWTKEPPVDTADQVFEYRDSLDRSIRVVRGRTASGGLVRTAMHIIARRKSDVVLGDTDERWCTDGDPHAEATIAFTINADGTMSRDPPGEDIKPLWGLSPDFDVTDTAAVLARIVQSPAEAEMQSASLTELVTSLTPQFWDVRVRGGDDRLRWINWAATAIRKPDGSTSISCRLRDITREKLAEDQLELLRSAVTHATDAIQILHTDADRATTTIYANPAFEILTGWSMPELLGRSIPPPKPNEEGTLATFLAMAERGEQQRVEVQSRHKDGTPFWLEASAKVVEHRPDGGFRWVLVSRNIDERRSAQEQLRGARDDADAANKSKSEFLANMSHEIRTPLTSVIGFAGLLAQVDGLPERAQAYVRRISVGGQSLLSVINDVLDFSKIEAGQVELDPHTFAPAECVEEIVGLLTSQAEKKGLDLRAELAPGTPDWVTADSARIGQVLINLVGNAVKFTNAGSVAVALTFETGDGSADRLRFAVSDTGPGIGDDVRDRLFQRFSQVDGTVSRRHGGTGLGLAICKGLVELMGGALGVDSEVGKGSTFWFTVPVAVAEPGVEETRTPDDDGFGAAPARILIVDDVAVNRELVRAMLTPFGHTFEEAENGAEAVNAAMRSRFDLILMDLQMPGMDGFAAARAIRAAAEPNQTTPILALSANVMSEHIAAAKAAGMNDHIGKPILPIELLTKVAMWTSQMQDEPTAIRAAS